MNISVIICTAGRAAVLRELLESLEAQTYANFETLLVDGNDDPSPAREVLDTFSRRQDAALQVRPIESARGLAHQRNVGIEQAKGSIVCFLDDDVTLPPDFLLKVADIFADPRMQDVGGLTGYDEKNYPVAITRRWRLRRLLGVIPDLPPGGVDRLGRGIPLGFLQPFTGFKEVGLLPGFCMIFRRSAMANLRFDELIPTYAGEDRDFSMRVGWRSRMQICGDLRLQHHASPEGRDSDLKRNFQSGYGMGRRFAKYARGGGDRLRLLATFLGDSAIDLLFLLTHPTRANIRITGTRMAGFFAGLRSAPAVKESAVFPPKISSPEQPNRGVSSVQ